MTFMHVYTYVYYNSYTNFPEVFRCRVNVAQIIQSRPDSGLGLQVKVLRTFAGVLFRVGGSAANEVLLFAVERMWHI